MYEQGPLLDCCGRVPQDCGVTFDRKSKRMAVDKLPVHGRPVTYCVGAKVNGWLWTSCLSMAVRLLTASGYNFEPQRLQSK